MGSGEQIPSGNKDLPPLTLIKIIIVITVIVGSVGILTRPPDGQPFNASAVNNVSIWLMGLLNLIYISFILGGILKYALVWKSGDVRKIKDAQLFICYVVVGFLLLLISYSLSVSIEVFI